MVTPSSAATYMGRHPVPAMLVLPSQAARAALGMRLSSVRTCPEPMLHETVDGALVLR